MRLGSTWVSGTWPANAVIASCIRCELPTQSGAPPTCVTQQLWNSLRSRSTKREFAGSSRSILAFAASYAVATASASDDGPSAKNGCCFTAEPDEWHCEQNCESTGYTVLANAASLCGKLR